MKDLYVSIQQAKTTRDWLENLDRLTDLPEDVTHEDLLVMATIADDITNAFRDAEKRLCDLKKELTSLLESQLP